MAALLAGVDPGGLLEYSVVYTDRALNHMSQNFQTVMRDISLLLKEVYRSAAVIVVPGNGTLAMEAVARQFATGRRCLVIRNGWFSYRWSQIFEVGSIPAQETVMKARPVAGGPWAAYAPAPIEEVEAAIAEQRPELVFATHVETAAGLMLPEEYISRLADAVHRVGGLLVLDCVASGTIWVDMAATGVDILITAPQKGWSSSPCCGLVMLGERGMQHIEETNSTSFAVDLKKWLRIMQAYESGSHAYHATLPTDALARLRDTIAEIKTFGFAAARQRQEELGRRVRALLRDKGVVSVAAEGFEAPGVVVSYTDDHDLHTGRRFAEHGLQIAAGVPLCCDEPAGFQTFRIGLFGLEKLADVDGAVKRLSTVLGKIFPANG